MLIEKNKIKNLIFDFDGTIADTSKLIVATMQKTIRDCKLPFKSEEEIKSTIGVRLEEIPDLLWPKINGISHIFAFTYRNNFEEYKNLIPVSLFPHVKETLQNFKENGFKMAIATSRSHKSVEKLINKLDIEDSFNFILGGDDVSNGKPDPESIYNIIHNLKLNPQETMMTGDMAVDILMGKNAGINTCGVTYGNGKQKELEKEGADIIIDSFDKISEIL